MLLFDIFRRRKPQPQPLRHVVATKAENAEVRRKQASVRGQLAVYIATSTPEQRRAETEAYFELMRQVRAA